MLSPEFTCALRSLILLMRIGATPRKPVGRFSVAITTPLGPMYLAVGGER